MLIRAYGTPRVGVMTRDTSLVMAICHTLEGDGAQCSLVRRHGAVTRGDLPGSLYDVVILDHCSIAYLLRQMRRLRCQAPTCGIMVVNVRSQEECIRLLEAGADDACTSDPHMIRARVRALTRRADVLNAELRVAYGDLIVDREHRRIWSGTTELPLTPREYDLLLRLYHVAPSPVSKRTLAAALWKEDSATQRNTVEVYVSYLRRKLAQSACVRVETVRGVGYALTSRAVATAR
jgi:two-component system OmpR family response regulator